VLRKYLQTCPGNNWHVLEPKAASNKRLERTRHERASLVRCVGEPLKRSVMPLRVLLHLSLMDVQRYIDLRDDVPVASVSLGYTTVTLFPASELKDAQVATASAIRENHLQERKRAIGRRVGS
jgi:hypothetical protein